MPQLMEALPGWQFLSCLHYDGYQILGNSAKSESVAGRMALCQATPSFKYLGIKKGVRELIVET